MRKGYGRTAIAGAAAVAVLLGGCSSPGQEVSWTVGACARVDDRGTTAVDCFEPHTHRVIAIVPNAEACPRDTDMYASPADLDDPASTTCFQLDSAER